MEVGLQITCFGGFGGLANNPYITGSGAVRLMTLLYCAQPTGHQGNKMSIKDDLGLIEKYREIQKVGAAKVVISQDQVLEIVVADLITKYKASKKRNDEYTEPFEKVLRFYLTDSEMAEVEAI